MKASDRLQKLLSSTCTVIGLGISNLPLIDWLLSKGVSVTARDRKTAEELGAAAETLRQKGVRLFLGENYLQGITEDVIFRSPGLRPDAEELEEARKRGAVITSEMQLFLELTPAATVGITGSDGKTTSTTLTYLFLKAEAEKAGKGRVFVGGNIGAPLLPLVDEMTEDDIAVLELSSFQLFELPVSTERAALTNLSPNHLNWHRDMEEYGEAKTNLFRHRENRLLVTNRENAEAMELSKICRSPVTLFSSKRNLFTETGKAIYLKDGWIVFCRNGREEPIVRTDEILLPGVHNLENYMTAIGLTDGTVSAETVRKVAASFKGVKHRLEYLGTHGGVKYYNSSIDSSPTRTGAALSALKEKPVVICGGCDKHISFLPLAEALKERAKAVVLTGATAKAIEEALNRTEGELPVYRNPDFEGAVKLARDIAESGDTVLLSPACASFDAFRNFEERGDTFRRIVDSFGNGNE